MSKKQSTILVITFILIAAVAVVVWGGERKQPEQPSPAGNGGDVVSQDSNIPQNREDIDTNDNDNDPISISDEDPIVITSDIDTSDWKTYRNEELGFSFRYPEGWVISSELKRGEPKSDPILNLLRIDIDDLESGIKLVVNVSEINHVQLPEEILADEFVNNATKQKILFSGIEANKYIGTKLQSISILISQDNKVFNVTMSGFSEDTKSEANEIIDALLSSIKF